MRPLYAIPQAIQPLSQTHQVQHDIYNSKNHVFALFHKVKLQAFKFPLPNFYLGMGNYKLEVE
jgi:hypothetical protein